MCNISEPWSSAALAGILKVPIFSPHPRAPHQPQFTVGSRLRLTKARFSAHAFELCGIILSMRSKATGPIFLLGATRFLSLEPVAQPISLLAHCLIGEEERHTYVTLLLVCPRKRKRRSWSFQDGKRVSFGEGI